MERKTVPPHIYVVDQQDIATIYKYRYKEVYKPHARNESAVFAYDDQLITLAKNGLLKHEYKPYK